MKTKMKTLISLLIVFLLLPTSSPANNKIKIIVFDAELVDSSVEGDLYGEKPEQTQRLKKITEQLRQGLSESGLYDVLDIKDVQEEVDAIKNTVRFLHDCNGCDIDLARTLGVEQSAAVWVQKVSNLIINLNVVIKDTTTGAQKKTAFVDIRGNNDKSWQRGMRYMLKNRLLKNNQ